MMAYITTLHHMQLTASESPGITYACSDCTEFVSTDSDEAACHMMYHLPEVDGYTLKRVCSICGDVIDSIVEHQARKRCEFNDPEAIDVRAVILEYMVRTGSAFAWCRMDDPLAPCVRWEGNANCFFTLRQSLHSRCCPYAGEWIV